MRVAVTGGSGFIGTHLVQKLVDAGHKVAVLGQAPSSVAGASWKPADILELDTLVEATRNVDVVYHLAAVSNVNVAFSNPMGCVEANVYGTANVLEAARTNKLQRVIFASTVWVYRGANETQVTEDSALVPGKVGHLYTSSKVASEMLCHSYKELYGVPFTILRFGIPYGPGMRPELVVSAFIRKALNNEPITIQGDGKQYRKFIYVGDLAEGNVAALSPKAENQTYNLDGSEQVTILGIAESLKGIMGNVQIQFLPARPGDFSGAETTSVKAEQDLGWRARTSFEEGLRMTVGWYRSQQKATEPAFASRKS